MPRKTAGLYHGGLCFVTHRPLCAGGDLLTTTRLVLEAGVRWVQYREKDLSRRRMYEEALALRKLTADFGALFVINDQADLAAAVGADGVHLGQDDLPVEPARKLLGKAATIGISTHNASEAREAEARGADYVGFGPIYRTSTKETGEPEGPEGIRRVFESISIPIVAIGGIGVESIPDVTSAGAGAVAVASALLCEAGKVAENTRAFLVALGTS